MSEGVQLRDGGKIKVAENNRDFLSLIRQHAVHLANINGSVTSDDLRRYALTIDLHPTHPNAWGSVFRGDNWVLLGYKQSEFKTNHARTIRIWGLRKI